MRSVSGTFFSSRQFQSWFLCGLLGTIEMWRPLMSNEHSCITCDYGTELLPSGQSPMTAREGVFFYREKNHEDPVSPTHVPVVPFWSRVRRLGTLKFSR